MERVMQSQVADELAMVVDCRRVEHAGNVRKEMTRNVSLELAKQRRGMFCLRRGPFRRGHLRVVKDDIHVW